LDKSGDHKAFIVCRDGAGDVPFVRLKARGYLNIPQLSLEAANLFIVLGHKVLLSQDLLLSLSKLLGKLVSMMVDGGDKAVGGGTNSVAKVLLLKE